MRMTEHTMAARDGAEIFYRAWSPESPPKKFVLLFHRGHEHSARWQETVEKLAIDDCAVFAWDQRGHGRSSGKRGHAPNLAAVVKDADEFSRHLCEAHGVRLADTAVIAHSVGAVVATAWVHDYAPPIRALVLGAPAFRVKLYVPLAVPMLRLKQRVLGPGIVKSYVKAKMLTHDAEQAESYRKDPMIFREIAVNILLDLKDTSTRLIEDAGAITVPTLIVGAGNDWVVTVKAQREFFRKLGSPIKQFDIFPGMFHAMFHEKGREKVIKRIRSFLDERFSTAANSVGNLDADKGGYTRTEFDVLRAPGPAYWSLVRSSLKLGGRFSEGIGLGWRTGFDSGVTLDYVYENKPKGFSPLGKAVDYFYLNSIGWRGIRLRRENLQRVLQQCIDDLKREDKPIGFLDIACGAGRYVLETMAANGATDSSAVLRDYKPENLDAARKHAARLGLNSVVFEQADAFDRASIAAIRPRPTIAIVSGLYELFPENAPLRRSLEGLAEAVEEGGFLVYTCQPWHPQVEFIARALTNREGQPWVMRRRTQAEMDELVRAAGFEKIAQEIDPWGIFTVSAARRVTK
ncbi:MAG: bifunctional alpha/beta hydrolase/class I SAM-dependent methyltransferase [Phycisphaeraceae bacterium]|nr:bifunctional alpha/beta hydrolase/class I SAM-dependent methyltransferase [Phycisphaeraceae bacterium]